MKVSKKILSLLLVLAMVFAMAMPALAADANEGIMLISDNPDEGIMLISETPDGEAVPISDNPDDGIMPIADEDTDAAEPGEGEESAEQGKIVILHTNDVHCGVDQVTKNDAVTNIGYAGVASYKAEMESTYGEANVTLIDAGDAIQGGPLGTLTKGSAIVEIMNSVGYDLAIPGNHEFDYGMDNFLNLAKEAAQYTYICANFTNLEGTPVFDGYKVISYGNVKVAYVGIDTPETFTKSTPTYFQDTEGNYIYSFQQGNNGQDLYAAVQTAVDAAKAECADYVVAVGHLGDNGSTDEWKAASVIANTTGIDVFIDGHSHEQIEQTVANKDGSDVVWAQTGTKLACIGKIVIDTETGEITHELVSGYDKQDETVLAFVNEINDKFEEQLNQVVAKSEVNLTTKDADGNRAVRSAETNLGDLCADAYRTMLDADIAFVNGGGVRADIAAGDITYQDIISVHPFGNEACLVETNGQDILDALEFGSRNVPDENGGFLQVSGVTYTINTAIPSSVVLNDEQEFVKVDGAYRVTNVLVNGEPLDVEKTYTLASHNYMIKSGGDGFVMFKDDTLLKDSVMIDNAVLINYIVDELGGVVTAEQYGESQGRIKIVNRPADLDADAWWYNAAVAVLDSKAMQGTGNGFEASLKVTRATVFQVLYNLEGKPAVEDATVADAEGMWYADAVNWAASAGLLEGDSFGTDTTILRGDIYDLLLAYGEKKGLDYTNVMVGDGLGEMNPEVAVDRGQLAQVLVNMSKITAPAA